MTQTQSGPPAVVPRPDGRPWPPERCRYTAFHGDSRPETPLTAAIEDLAVVEAHVLTEEANDIPRIMGTVHPQPRFGLSNVPGRPGFQMLTTTEDVRQYYVESRATFEILRSRAIKQICTDWYVYRESVSTTRPLSIVDGQRVTAEERTGNIVAFFPSNPGGIVCELPLGRTAIPPAPSAMLPAPKNSGNFPEIQVRNNDLHDRLVEAMYRGDIPGILSRVTDDCLWITRNYFDDSGPMAACRGKDQLRGFFEKMYRAVDVLGITIVHRVAADWYVFAELLLRLRQRGPLFGISPSGAEFTIRLAGPHPVREDGLFSGLHGWGTDMQQATTGGHS